MPPIMVLQHRVKELARLLGVAIGQQLQALEIGEEHRDLLPFLFQALRSET